MVLHRRLLIRIITALLRSAVITNDLRLLAPQRWRHFMASVHGVLRHWRRLHAMEIPRFVRGRRSWNRTPDHIERNVVRLHVDQSLLGAGQLRQLAARVLGFHAARETFRKVLIRNKDLIVLFEHERRRPRRKIRVAGIRHLWVLSDNDPRFLAESFVATLHRHGIRHVRTRVAHPWTNGRIERLFRTFKETVFSLTWLLRSRRQLDRFAADFVTFYNRDRPHSSFSGRTPAEVFFGREIRRRPLGRISYFDQRLRWYRFG